MSGSDSNLAQVKPATTIKGVESHEVYTAIDRRDGQMKYFRKGKELPLEDGFALSLDKDKPFDRSGLGVFAGFGKGILNQAMKYKLKGT